MADSKSFDFDVVSIGGGSGGLAFVKEAARLGKKAACFDFVKPSHKGTTWGLGGTCVNVGCIPKKIFHYTGLLNGSFADARALGWELPSTVSHDWYTLRDNVQDFIGNLNYGYVTQLQEKKVTYINAQVSNFVDPHTVEFIDPETQEPRRLTARQFVIAVGCRPNLPDIPGAELGITSDDIFQVDEPPGKTLVVGASYIALECAGFLHEFGYDTTVMVRSIVLRGFDRQSAEIVRETMDRSGVKFLQGFTPKKLERMDDSTIKVTSESKSGEEITDTFETVLFAIGRHAVVAGLGLEKLGVRIEKGKIVTDDYDCTSVPSIFAIGDVALGNPELTPVAIKAGQYLAQRLAGQQDRRVGAAPTVVFTPFEYGCVGLSQEDATEQYGADALEIYLKRFGSLEQAAANKTDAKGQEFTQPNFIKLVCLRSEGDRVVGLHYVGPHAGEIVQGMALAVELGATKRHFDALVGIHPTIAEEFTSVDITERSGLPFEKADGC